MVLTSLELDAETYEKVRKSGITLRKLVIMGLNSVQERRQFNEMKGEYDEGFKRLSGKITQLMGRIIVLENEKGGENV